MNTINHKSLSEENKNKADKLMRYRDISIWLDNYDDIFSDFDPRPYSERVLSDDFLVEVRKVCRENEEMINELKLLMPADKRKNDDETIIKNKLHNHFKKNHHQYEEQYKNVLKKGIAFSLIGMTMMLISSYISLSHSDSFLMHLLLVVFEPSGWFLVLSGFDIIVYTSKHNKKELDFYKKLSKSKIVFFPI